MTSYPEGNFTIVNNETGRALRVRLGKTKDVSQHHAGTVYLQYVTEKPFLQLGEADNSPATVWWHNTSHEDSRQITSYAVGEYQNIGDYCVWMDASTNGQDVFDARAAFENRLNDLPADVHGRLAPLIPAEWASLRARQRADRAESAWFQKQEAFRALGDAEQEAWAEQDSPPSPEDLAALRSYRYAVAEGAAPYLGVMNDVVKAFGTSDPAELAVLFATEPERLDTSRRDALSLLSPEEREGALGIDWATLNRLDADSRASKVEARTRELLPAVKERRAAAALAAHPMEDLRKWHYYCAFRKAYGDEVVIRFADNKDATRDKRIVAGLEAYVAAAAKEGIVPPVIASNATTRMHGCGVGRGEGSTYGWAYDGTYIYGADSKTVPSERTYWTDEDGYLVGKPKGGPGQTWSIKPWTPTKPPEGISRTDIALTGLFGPIGRALGL
ncbi:hypothetical protein [Streptomyces sp. YPW6]|uniref:hypothetical protein n=1 Tax=Streptomyces sp. YPW6 TaxID=2840373 RepID=UPI003EBDD631